MRFIDTNLDKINNTDDLSYAIKDSATSEPGELQIAIVDKKLIDSETLNKLIDETREEVEKLREMDAASGQLKVYKQLP